MRVTWQCPAAPGRWLLPSLLALVLAMPAEAQDTARVGDVVRIQLRGHPYPSYEGPLLTLDGGMLAIAPRADATATFSIPRSEIFRVWVDDGRSRSTLTGLGLGFLAGAALGAAVGAIAYQRPDCQDNPFCERSSWALAGGAVGGACGLLVGGIAGSMTWHERWRPVELPAAVSVAPAGRGRFGLAVRARL